MLLDRYNLKIQKKQTSICKIGSTLIAGIDKTSAFKIFKIAQKKKNNKVIIELVKAKKNKKKYKKVKTYSV